MGMAVSPAGEIWAWGGGLSTFSDGLWQADRGETGLPSPLVEWFAFDPTGLAWAIGYHPNDNGSQAGWVASFDGTAWTDHTTIYKLPKGSPRELVVEPDAVWVLFDPTSKESEAGSNGSVARFDGTGWVIFEADEPPAEWAGILDRYRAMRRGDFVIGPDGTRWETSRNGIYRITFVAGGADSTTEQRPTDTEPAEATQPTITTSISGTSTPDRPEVQDLAPGLSCEQLAAAGYPYDEAVVYWMIGGERFDLDPDQNGVPCEGVYQQAEIAAYWGEDLPTTTVATSPIPFPLGVSDDGAAGSGCSPGDGPLPDGIWFGYPSGAGPDVLGFDLACLWVDLESGAWSITNDSTSVREIPMAARAIAHVIMGEPLYTVVPYTEWTGQPCALDPDCPIWLYVNFGEVTDVVEHLEP
jgi:hypothetical protein